MISLEIFLNFSSTKLVLLLLFLSFSPGCDSTFMSQNTIDKSAVSDHQKIVDILNKNYERFATEVSLATDSESLDQLSECVSEIVTELDMTMKKYDDLPVLTTSESCKYANLLLNTTLELPLIPREKNRQLVEAIQIFRAKHFEVCTKYGFVEVVQDD